MESTKVLRPITHASLPHEYQFHLRLRTPGWRLPQPWSFLGPKTRWRRWHDQRVTKKPRKPSLSEIAEELRSAPAKAPDDAHAVRPGLFNAAGEFFDRNGARLERVETEVAPKRAQQLVSEGAVVTWIDLWRNDAGDVVFAHGDVKWDGVFRTTQA